MDIRRSALVACPAAQTFDLIEAAEHYPEFLPWCADAVILERDNHLVVACITIELIGFRFRLTTRNPKRRPHWMAIHMEQGPFRRFEGEWRLKEIAADACRIDFDLRYEWRGALTERLAARFFGGVTDTLVDAFARRAEQGRTS
jgi:ribosome-associated toxin RatA of RatAB toxin-antitoxin module